MTSSLANAESMNNHRAILRWSCVLLVFFTGLILCSKLSLNDNAMDLLPGEAVRGDIQYLQQMGLVDRLFITLTASEQTSVRELRRSVVLLGQLLKKSDHFSYVLYRLPQGYEHGLFSTLQPSLPYLLDEKDRRLLEQRVAPEEIKAKLEESFALLNSPAGLAMKKQVQLDPLGLISMVLQKMVHLKSEVAMHLDDGFFVSNDGKSCLLMAESKSSLTDSKDAQIIQNILDDAYVQSLAKGVVPSVIGSLPHTLANSSSVERDLRILLPVAMVLLVLLLGFTLKDVRALVVMGVPLLAAPPAIGLTSILYGQLGGVALGFGIVLLGIAVDFSIHLFLALRDEKGSRHQILRQLGRPVLFATMTTSAVFIILLFSEVASHRQMATLALFGVLLAVFFGWLLVPTISFSRNTNTRQPTLGKQAAISKYPKGAIGFWLLLIICGILSWPRLQYNGNLSVLDVPNEEVKKDEHHFGKTWGEKGEQAFIVAEGENLGEALDRNSNIYSLLQEIGTQDYQSFAPILPGPQTQKHNLLGWNAFWEPRAEVFSDQFREAAKGQGFSPRAFLPFFTWLQGSPQYLSPEKLFSGTLEPIFRSMLKTVELPTGVTKYMAMTTVAIDGATLTRLLQVAEEDEQIHVLANMKWRAEVERLLKHDIYSLSLLAGGCVLLLVWFQFRRGRAVLAVLAPVLSALAAMSVFCFITDGQLNMMHLIMGIMVIGLSVDYGIFIVCAQLEKHSTSARAVSICAASSLIGFGVLAFANHPALHSLGITVLVGIGVAWPTATIVSPILLFQEEG